jgi:hypothetical protein
MIDWTDWYIAGTTFILWLILCIGAISIAVTVFVSALINKIWNKYDQ